MSKPKSDAYPAGRLSSLREKIVFCLSENPNLNAQALQKTLGYPSNQYPNISKALKTLEKSGLIRSKHGKSKKNVQIKLYRSTDNGILYALGRNPKADALKTINVYENLEDIAKTFRVLYNIMGPELYFSFVRDWNDFMPMIQKEGIDNVAPHIVMRAMMLTDHLDLDTHTRIVKQLLEQFPQTKRALKDWSDYISKLF